MYHVTEAVAALFDSEQYQILRITGTDSGGNAISITAENVMVNGFNIDRYCCNSNRLEIGTAVAAEMTLKLNNADGTFDSINFEGAELFVEIGIADWNMLGLNNWITQDGDYLVDSNGNRLLFNIEGPIYWIPCGYFTPDEQPRNRTIITLSALDRMMRFEREFDDAPYAVIASDSDYSNTTAMPGYFIQAIAYGTYQIGDLYEYANGSLWYFQATYDMDVYVVVSNPTHISPSQIGVFNGQPYGNENLVEIAYRLSSGSTSNYPTASNPFHVLAGQYVTFSISSYVSEATWTLYSRGRISFPTTVSQIVTSCCSACDVIPAANISALPNATLSIPSLPENSDSITYRDLIQWCAGLMGTNAFIDWNGQLRFAWYSDTGYNSTPDRRFSSDLYENDITVTGVTYTDAEQTTHLAGTDTYTLDLSDNALIATLDANNIDAALQSVNVVTQGFTYRPFEAKVFAAPWLFPMDRVTFTDKQGVTHLSALTNVNLTINGETSLKSSGETAQTNSYAGSYGIAAEQAVVLRRVLQSSNEQIEAAVAEATSQITGAEDSHIKFVYDENGGLSEILVMDTDDINTAVNVWRWNSGGLGHSSNGYNGNYTLAMTQNGSIVATMITTGILNASVIKAGIISDVMGNSSWNLATGELVINNGYFSTASDDGYGNTVRTRIANGSIALIVNNVIGGEIRPSESGIYIFTNSNDPSENYGGLSLAAMDSNDDIASGVDLYPNGKIMFSVKSGSDIVLAIDDGSVFAQYNTIRSGSFRSADGQTFIIRNGLLFSN